jgi:hypothetical protein
MMDRATLERIAKEAGLDVVGGVVLGMTVGLLSRFAMFVAEDCAKVCEAEAQSCPASDEAEGFRQAADIIRERFGAPP